MKLAQTLAGSWVITVANTEEEGWETQLAEFDMTAVGPGSPAEDALEQAAADAYASLLGAFSRDRVEVQSHDPEAQARMTGRVGMARLRGEPELA